MAVDVIQKQKIKYGKETEQFEYDIISHDAECGTKDHHQYSCYQLKIADGTDNTEIISMNMMEYNLQRLGNMKTVGNDNF